MLRDNGTQQAFSDIIDYTLATPAVVPNNSPELTQFVVAALSEYSRYRALKKPYTLDVVAGTSTYTLPVDWMAPDLVAFNRVTRPRRQHPRPHYMLPGAPCLGPVGDRDRLEYEWYNDLQQVVLCPAPLSTYSIPFSYFAQQTSSTIPAQWLEAALAPACELALRAIATDQTMKLQQYRLANGKLEVDNRTIKDALLKQADEWQVRFRREVVLRPHAVAG
jgi:hypothetical protein